MRRASVHRVFLEFTGEVTTSTIDGRRGDAKVLQVPQEGYRTRCGITGGAELLALTGINNGAGRWCGNCYSGTHKVGYRPRPVPENRWTAVGRDYYPEGGMTRVPHA